ncbi:hypothetical protein TIFTF001_040788 [Ficus carica]|uniref:Uncharacterized protein n=1 Tax=Ficus carica TaxID=3494 RepID=A0AA87ZGI6_FICCA|nr:hypothetical protein TIFTF001_040788 [Ficus carica]
MDPSSFRPTSGNYVKGGKSSIATLPRVIRTTPTCDETRNLRSLQERLYTQNLGIAVDATNDGGVPFDKSNLNATRRSLDKFD